MKRLLIILAIILLAAGIGGCTHTLWTTGRMAGGLMYLFGFALAAAFVLPS